MTSYTQPFLLYPQGTLPIEQITDKARIFAVMDSGERITVVLWKEKDAEWGTHTSWSSCDCDEDATKLDTHGVCVHVGTALNQVMTGTYTYNEKET